jgi:putative transposase
MHSAPVLHKIVTDPLRGYPAANAEIAEFACMKHVFVKAAARVNNRVENSHQPTRGRERQTRGFCDPRRMQAFLSCFGPIRQHFGSPGHRKTVSCHHAQLKALFTVWQRWTVADALANAI